jgi:integrase
MKLPRYVRLKTAKGKTYYYFDAGKDGNGKRVLIKLPDIKNPGFGGALARAQATRTNRTNRQGVLTLDGLIRAYEKSPEFDMLAESSKRSYGRYLAMANKLLRDKAGNSAPARSITKGDVIDLRDQLVVTKGAANQTIRAVGALYKWAVDNEKADKNPAQGVKLFQATDHQPWPEELLEEALQDPQVGMAVGLFYFTGQRINEVVKMTWRDIHPTHMDVFVQKTTSDCKVAILPELREMLDQERKRPTNALTVLTNANGAPWSQSGLRQKLQAWAKERGHKVVPHGLRKNAVNSLFEAGCTAAEVSGITDQSMSMLEHYAKGRNKLKLGQSAVVKLDAHRKAKNNA